MTASLYDESIPPLKLGLENLSFLLDKAAAHAEAKKIDPKVIADARLIADMFPLARQVQIACDTAKGAAARLAGVDIPKHEDNETTLSELKARIGKTLDFIASVKPAQFAGAATREVVLKFPNGSLTFTGADYLRKFVLPNFYFHLTVAYALLRANGVEIGKQDYLGKIQ
jgi:uncharacterized protein